MKRKNEKQAGLVPRPVYWYFLFSYKLERSENYSISGNCTKGHFIN